MIRRSNGMVVYSGPHVGSRGTLRSIREGGADDLSEGIPEADKMWEQAVREAMITREASFGERWHGDWEAWDEPDTGEMVLLWGPGYRRREPMEPPFGRR